MPTSAPSPGVSTRADLAEAKGARPVAIDVAAAGVAAEIETINIIDGVMQDPTEPLLVSWYEESAKLGEIGNILLAGHVNWYSIGAAVFFNLEDLAEDDEIVATGEDGELYRYAVQWNETVEAGHIDARADARTRRPDEDRERDADHLWR